VFEFDANFFERPALTMEGRIGRGDRILDWNCRSEKESLSGHFTKCHKGGGDSPTFSRRSSSIRQPSLLIVRGGGRKTGKQKRSASHQESRLNKCPAIC